MSVLRILMSNAAKAGPGRGDAPYTAGCGGNCLLGIAVDPSAFVPPPDLEAR